MADERQPEEETQEGKAGVTPSAENVEDSKDAAKAQPEGSGVGDVEPKPKRKAAETKAVAGDGEVAGKQDGKEDPAPKEKKAAPDAPAAKVETKEARKPADAEGAKPAPKPATKPAAGSKQVAEKPEPAATTAKAAGGDENVPPGYRERPGVKRRALLRSLMWGSVLLFFAETAGAGLAMFWPRKVKGFGAKIVAGTVADFPPDSVTVVRDGKFYISHVTEKDPDTGEEYGARGLMALYWKCTHLGCTVPWAPGDDPHTFRHFHCPCHASTFNRVGMVTGGPAPRPLDYMTLTVDDAGRVTVDTGDIHERQAFSPDQLTQV